ncbi:MAG: RidA family protein [Candidatus Korobacteraceae bacterium]|jgi:enamine deaminase RidA (YjgF/YER057c/UK114 family)
MLVMTACCLLLAASAFAQNKDGALPLSPPNSITPTGPWGLATLDQHNHVLYVAGMRGIDPKTSKLVDGAEARIRQAFLNMKHIVESAGGSLSQCLRVVVYTTDMYRYRPIANKVQEELWGKNPYPPRTIIEVHRLNEDDILEVEGTFYVPPK